MALFSADMGFLLLRMSASRSSEMGSCLTEPWVEEMGGVRLVRAYSQGLAFAILFAAPASRAIGPFDAKGKTTCCCAVYLQIVNFRMRKKFFDCRRSEERRVGKECRSRWWGYH